MSKRRIIICISIWIILSFIQAIIYFSLRNHGYDIVILSVYKIGSAFIIGFFTTLLLFVEYDINVKNGKK